MNKDHALEVLFGKIEANRHLNAAQALIHWDATTSGVPEKSLSARGATAGWLSGELLRRLISPDTLEAVETLKENYGELTEVERAMTREIDRRYRKLAAVPIDEYQAFNSLIAQAETVWESARALNDYGMILPYYEKIFDFQRRLCDWYGYDAHPYDALLDDYEKGADVRMLDAFFNTLRTDIVPLVRDISRSNVRYKEIKGFFDVSKQKALLPWLTDFTGYDRARGKTGEVEHPYSITISRHDVRITTKYHEDNLLSALFSTLHESGHAIYEQNMAEELERYGLAEAASMGFHESQSRMYENILCRSTAFAAQLLPRLRGQFDCFSDWDESALYRAINIARPSLIRIEADELTYCLHIIVRYELEKGLVKGDIRAADLPELWADKYEELIGVRPDSLSEGVLQDCHWSGGAVGYFPSYAIGSAYGAQIVHAMNRIVDTQRCIENGDLSPVNEWLRDNIHRHGAVMLPDALLRAATGESFNPGYYSDYLRRKFTDLYF